TVPRTVARRTLGALVHPRRSNGLAGEALRPCPLPRAPRRPAPTNPRPLPGLGRRTPSRNERRHRAARKATPRRLSIRRKCSRTCYERSVCRSRERSYELRKSSLHVGRDAWTRDCVFVYALESIESVGSGCGYFEATWPEDRRLW